jgi:hypothetical protein
VEKTSRPGVRSLVPFTDVPFADSFCLSTVHRPARWKGQANCWRNSFRLISFYSAHQFCCKASFRRLALAQINSLKRPYHSESPTYYAKLYERHGLHGAHVIKLGSGNDEAAKEALAAWPGTQAFVMYAYSRLEGDHA